ncbi:MAG: hypothetical protein DMF84_12910 [Acidobacteria bacterium]|nr:MAG: hypothetical protein DMF84_12910 [Acidobacteriota bacterium]
MRPQERCDSALQASAAAATETAIGRTGYPHLAPLVAASSSPAAVEEGSRDKAPRYTGRGSSRSRVPHIAKPVPLPPPGFDDLSIDEKIDYLQSLWVRIAASPEAVPIPEWHREILDQRLKDLEANPESGDSWDLVEERLRRKLDSRH